MCRPLRFILLSLFPAAAFAAPPDRRAAVEYWNTPRPADADPDPDLAYPAVVRGGRVTPDTLAVTVLEGVVVPGGLTPYEQRPGDRIAGDRVLTRGGEPVGLVVGSPPHLRRYDTVNGSRLDRVALDDPAAYRVSPVLGSLASDERLAVTRVSRKSTPKGRALDATPHHFAPFEHTLFLTLAEPLPAEGVLWVEVPGADGPVARGIELGPTARCPAVHCNQVGWHPADPAKRAFLSLWLPDGPPEYTDAGGAVDYAALAGRGGFESTFSVIDAASGRAVARGPVTLRKRPGEAEDFDWQLLPYPSDGGELKRNYAKTFVYEMSFGPDLWPDPSPGEYVVSVTGLGASLPFRIADDVWEGVFRHAMAGLYNHRAGLELDGRFGYARPRSLHPADGVTVHKSRLPIVVTGEGPSGNPVAYKSAVTKYLTDETNPDAWGGLMDAGDWDRRTQHLDVVADLLDLYALHPGYFGGFALNLPASGEVLPGPLYAGVDLPDVLDEAVWTLDFFRRVQEPGGGVSGGIEEEYADGRDSGSVESPSWLTDETAFSYAPDAWTSYRYAAAAAKAAVILEPLAPRVAAEFRRTGDAAWDWAERHRDPAELRPFLEEWAAEGKPGERGKRDEQGAKALGRIAEVTGAARGWAAAERFASDTPAAGGSGDLLGIVRSELPWAAKDYPDAPAGDEARAAWAIARSDRSPEPLRDQAAASLARTATEYGTVPQARMAFRQFKHPFTQHYYGSGVTPAELERTQARVHAAGLSHGDATVTRADLIDGLNYTLGGNPLDLSYAVGLGDRDPTAPLHLDSQATGDPAPPGIVIYGPHKPSFAGMYWWLYTAPTWSELYDGTAPLPPGSPARAIEPPKLTWPTVESFVDHPRYPMDTEYTVQQGITGVAFLAGVLAAEGDAE